MPLTVAFRLAPAKTHFASIPSFSFVTQVPSIALSASACALSSSEARATPPLVPRLAAIKIARTERPIADARTRDRFVTDMMIPHRGARTHFLLERPIPTGGNAIKRHWSELNHVTAIRARVPETIRLDCYRRFISNTHSSPARLRTPWNLPLPTFATTASPMVILRWPRKLK